MSACTKCAFDDCRQGRECPYRPIPDERIVCIAMIAMTVLVVLCAYLGEIFR